MAASIISRLTKKAARMLRQEYKAWGKDGVSWRKVSQTLYLRTGIKINAGILNGVAHEKRPPTPQVYKALGLPIPHYGRALACLACGEVHTRKSCPNKRTARPRPAPKPYKAALYLAAAELVEWDKHIEPPTPSQIESKVIELLEKAAKQ